MVNVEIMNYFQIECQVSLLLKGHSTILQGCTHHPQPHIITHLLHLVPLLPLLTLLSLSLSWAKPNPLRFLMPRSINSPSFIQQTLTECLTYFTETSRMPRRCRVLEAI